MTDRLYPSFATVAWKGRDTNWRSTMEGANAMPVHPRSRHPPGYSGHRHGIVNTFG